MSLLVYDFSTRKLFSIAWTCSFSTKSQELKEELNSHARRDYCQTFNERKNNNKSFKQDLLLSSRQSEESKYRPMISCWISGSDSIANWSLSWLLVILVWFIHTLILFIFKNYFVVLSLWSDSLNSSFMAQRTIRNCFLPTSFSFRILFTV